jgi:hypothetical protein
VRQGEREHVALSIEPAFVLMAASILTAALSSSAPSAVRTHNLELPPIFGAIPGVAVPRADPDAKQKRSIISPEMRQTSIAVPWSFIAPAKLVRRSRLLRKHLS